MYLRLPVTLAPADKERKKRIIQGLRGRSLEQALADPDLRRDLEAEANSAVPKKIVTRDLLAVADAAKKARLTGPSLAFSIFTADVIIVPGFLASQLEDNAPGGEGLIWIDLGLIAGTNELLKLKLADKTDDDFGAPGVNIVPDGAIPALYFGLRSALTASRYSVMEFGYDWRKHVDISATALANIIRDRTNNRPRQLHLVAHSQGSLIARR